MHHDCAFEPLATAACRRLLATAEIGRLAVSSGALPAVVPVHYTLDGDDVIVRAPGHREVPPMVHGAIVGFEVDDLDPIDGVPWYVCAIGRLDCLEQGTPARLDRAGSWSAAGAVARLDVGRLTGHRLAVLPC